MTYRLQFFSRPSDEDTIPLTAELGYDGSMSVETFKPEDIQGHLKSMDCIFGECLVIVEWSETQSSDNRVRHYKKAYRTERLADF